MSKRKAVSSQQGSKKKRANYPLPSRTNIDGPGIWATCDKGREKSAIGELYDLFESLAEELWPTENPKSSQDGNVDPEDNIESQILKEIEGIKRPRVEKRFANCHTGTPCVIFIGCKAPVDPVKLVLHHFQNVERTGITRTRHVLRLTPVSDSCVASTSEILVLARKLIPSGFAALPKNTEGLLGYRYKLELTFRNHDKVKKQGLIPLLVACVPPDVGHKVDLEHPEVVIFVQVLKSVCGISVVQHYERFKRFNVIQVGEAARRGSNPESSSDVASTSVDER